MKRLLIALGVFITALAATAGVAAQANTAGTRPHVKLETSSEPHAVRGVGAQWHAVTSVDSSLVKVSHGRALGLAQANHLFQDLAHGAKTTDAVLAQYMNTNGKLTANGSMTPSVPQQLAWVVTAHQVPLSLVLSPVDQTAQPAPDGTVCDMYIVLSAADGSLLDLFRDCEGPIVP